MNTSISSCKKFVLIAALGVLPATMIAQKDSSFVKRLPEDTTQPKMNADAIYNRPFMRIGKMPIAIGGYMEVNTNYSGTDGVTEGFSFQFRRLTIFMSSTITDRIRFLSEIEFEDGTKEINIEFAALDFGFHPMLNLRTGIVMNPIGAFNQNHDGPRWDFVERPISATRMLPATWSNAGMGLFGKYYTAKWSFGYEVYLTNGFDESIIANSENRTFLPATKANPDRFEESFNGSPMTTARAALSRRKYFEIGFSYMGGVYNKFQEDGIILAPRRRVDVIAFDFTTTVPKLNTTITGEVAQVIVEVPPTYSQQFGSKQFGGYVDIIQPILQRTMLGWENAKLSTGIRLEYIDWNVGTFNETGGNISDHIYAVCPTVSFRPSGSTVLRLNYRYEWQTDLLGNPAARTAAIQFGVASYF
jgi:hypothetical protein